MSYIVCVPHLQDGRGAVHLASEGGHATRADAEGGVWFSNRHQRQSEHLDSAWDKTLAGDESSLCAVDEFEEDCFMGY